MPAGPVKRSLNATLSLPREPVSEILGKYAARATATRALAAISVCSACTRSGRRRSRSKGSPEGALVNRPGAPAEQHRERVFLLRALLLEHRHLRALGSDVGLELAVVVLGDVAELGALFLQLQRFG